MKCAAAGSGAEDDLVHARGTRGRRCEEGAKSHGVEEPEGDTTLSMSGCHSMPAAGIAGPTTFRN